MKFIYFFILLFFCHSLFAKECDLTTPVKSFHPQFATHFHIDYYRDFKIVHVDQEKYLLSDKQNLGCELAILKIRTPVSKVVMMSTTYLPALELIHQEKSLMGFQGKQYIFSTAFNLAQIKDIAFKFNPEYLLELKADLIMGYDSNLTSVKQKKLLNSLNIPVVINKDFEEQSPLARAEWLIFISAFYNQDEVAISIFNSIKKNYLETKALSFQTNKKSKVLVGEIQNGYWVTCGGQSDLAQLINDAGGKLAFNIPSPSTQKINLEELSQHKEIYDIWLTHNSWVSKEELNADLKNDNRYLLINTKKKYNNNLILNKNKSNDYWETGLQRPDLLLLDLVSIFHPTRIKNHKLQWYREL